MLVEFAQFLFENKDNPNLVDIATKEIMKYLPEDERREDYARGMLRILENENINLTDNVCISPILHVCCKNGELVPLTPTEFKIIEILAYNVDRIVTYDKLINTVWGFGDKEALKVNICNLRHKLKLNILTFKNVGYMVQKAP